MQITVRQAATYLGVDEATVRRWIADKGLPVHRVSERLHLNAIEVWEWAVERGIPVSRKLLEEAQRAPERVPSLAELVKAGGIHRQVEGDDKQAVLRAIVQRLPLPADADRDHLVAVLEAREAMGSTGIGGGIAIPHVRNPILLHVRQPSVSVFFLRRPVDYQSIDAQPVHTVFLVISPSVPVHLGILAQLGYTLRDESLRSLLQARAADDQILARLAALEQLRSGAFPAAGGAALEEGTSRQ
jgi:PTS system nitrogen regulatory IIA component